MSADSARDIRWMMAALGQAHRAAARGEVPVGAVLVDAADRLLGAGHNRPIAGCDPTLHAEIDAIRRAARAVGNYRLPGTTLYITLEPCPMCAGAILQARIGRVVFGAGDSRLGAAGTVFNLLDCPGFNHRVRVIGGVLGEECGELLRGFFRARRR